MLIVFPVLYPELLPRPAPVGALFLDPGYEDVPRDGAWRPQGLPLEPWAARALVADAMGFGAQFRHPGEMTSYALAPGKRAETPSAIRSELLARVRGQTAGTGEDPERAQAQFVLLLAWVQQQRRAEAEMLRRGAADARARLDRTLIGGAAGEPDPLETDPADPEALAIGAALAHFDLPLPDDDPLPWAGVLEAMVRFLPEDAHLWVTEPAAVAAFDAAVEFSALASDETGHLPAGTRCAHAPLWQLLGRPEPGQHAFWNRVCMVLTDLPTAGGA